MASLSSGHMIAHSSVLEAALFPDLDASLPLLPVLSCFLPPTFFFPDDQSISNPKSVLIGSRGLRKALCQW